MTKIIIWNGVNRTDCIDDVEARHTLADAAVEEHPELINATRPGGSSLCAPLHQAAYGGAPVEAVRRLVELGA